jgi:hypothetical protein
MIFQRLNSDHILNAAIERPKGGDFDGLLEQGSIAARAKRISASTGGYSKARKRVSLEVVERVVDALCGSQMDTSEGQRTFIVSGST